MKNPAYEQIQARKVRARLRMLQNAQRISGNVSQTCRFFGVSRALFYIWKERYEKHGVAGLRDLSRRPHKIRFRISPEIVSLILRIREERARQRFYQFAAIDEATRFRVLRIYDHDNSKTAIDFLGGPGALPLGDSDNSDR